MVREKMFLASPYGWSFVLSLSLIEHKTRKKKLPFKFQNLLFILLF